MRLKIFLLVVVVFISAFIVVAIRYRNYLLSKMTSVSHNVANNVYYSAPFHDIVPTVAIPTFSDTKNSVLGANDHSAPPPTPYPTMAPLPTSTPWPTLAPLPTTVIPTPAPAPSTASNSNCTTGSGTPNSWYSDVYPNPPINTNTGSVELVVVIRDCDIKTAPVGDKLTISLVSGDPNTQINGQAMPYTITAQNGQANFYVSSQVAGTVTLAVKDITSSFTITDISNNNPSITFSGSSSSTGTSTNSNCTTGAGVANSWYSDVYPVSPVTATVGSVANLNLVIRDCSQNPVSGTKSIKVSQTTNVAGVTVNGTSLPATFSAQNGQASFTVGSPNSGTVNLTVQDMTDSFTITDTSNQNPSVVFSGSTATPTPISVTPTVAPTNTPSPTASPSASPAPTVTSSPAPTGS